MMVFPQLITGGSGLYPIVKRKVRRTVVNGLGDGRTDTYSDPIGALTVWEFASRGLTRAEWNAIEALFQQTAGKLKTFTLLDPVGNLLANSELLSDNAWLKDAGIQLTTAVGDPLGTTRATRVTNSGQASEQVSQTVAAPGNFHYCVSGWFRGTSGSSIALEIQAGTASVSQTFPLNSYWQRLFVAGNPGQAAASAVAFSLQLAAGATAELFGLQAEAQLAPSDYKQNGSRGGVYAKARFAMDEITGRAQASDVHDSTIRIVSTEN